MSKNKREYSGLLNQGSTCYLNTVLQTLYMTQEYKDLIKRHKPDDRLKTNGELIAKLKELFDKLDKKKGPVSTSGITEILGIDVYQQLDAAEYLCTVLNKTPELSKIFMGTMKKTRTCKLCNKKTPSSSKFLFLHVPFEESQDVEDAIKEYIKPREHFDLHCQSCNKKAQMTTESEIESFPKILIIQLQRICDVRKSFYELNVKIRSHIEVSRQNYELYAVVNRYGTFDSGHYDVDIKSENQNWYKFDDSNVSQCEMLQSSSKACLLLYKHNISDMSTTMNLEQKNKYQEMQEAKKMYIDANTDFLYIETSSDKITSGRYIRYSDFSEVFRNVKTVLTEGEDDAGKHPLQQLILDWTEKKEDQDNKYIFPIHFQKLNTLAEENIKLSLIDLLQNICKNSLTPNTSDKVLLILDGLHEAKFHMDFEKSTNISDWSQPASIDVLLVNLIKGIICPDVYIWITSHPTAANKIPLDYINLLTRVHVSNQSTSSVQDNTQANTSVDKLSPSDKEDGKQDSEMSSSGLLTEGGCAALTSDIRLNSILRELDLSKNMIEDFGVQNLVDLLVKLENLKLSSCSIGEEGCVFLITALMSNPSPLRKLDLSGNTLKDSGIKFLSEMLKQPQSKLEKLRLRSCDITDSHCADLSSALRSNPSHLKELDLSGNCIKDSGVKEISALLKHPQCKLEKLRLSSCSITEDGCAALTADIRLNSHLRELELNENSIGNLGMKQLVDLLIHPWCKLEKLLLSSCSIGEAGCAVLRSALISNSSCLRKLDLSRNPIEDSGVKQLVDLLKHPQCKLEKLRLRNCSITENGCAALSSITSSKTEDVSAQIHADTDERMCKYF